MDRYIGFHVEGDPKHPRKTTPTATGVTHDEALASIAWPPTAAQKQTSPAGGEVWKSLRPGSGRTPGATAIEIVVDCDPCIDLRRLVSALSHAIHAVGDNAHHQECNRD
jgi:hypothetical protein